MTTTCLDCGVSTGVGASFGSVGLPSLDETARGRKRHPLSKILTTGGDADTDETFGYIYSGFKALGLTIHSLEVFRSFLVKHRKHRLFEWDDEEPNDRLPAEIANGGTRFLPYVEPSRGYVLARFVLTCAKCGERFESDGRDWVKPMKPRFLAPDAISTFHKRVGVPSEFCIRDADPFNVLYPELDEWLIDHRTHRPRLELNNTARRRAGVTPATPEERRAAGFWRLVGPLTVPETRFPPTAGVPVAGPRFLAFNTREFRGVLERRTHEVIWKGRVPFMWPHEWHSASLLLLDGYDEAGIWDVDKERILWRMETGAQPCALAHDCVVVFPETGGYELRDVTTGKLKSRNALERESPRQLQTVRGYLLHDTEHAPDVIVALDLARNRPAWRISLASLSPDESAIEPGFQSWVSSSGATVLLRQGPLAAALRLRDGEVVWRRRLEKGLEEKVVAAGGRFAGLSSGHFILIDEETGATIADRMIEGLQERNSVAAGDVLVTPTRTGRILTHALADGKLVDEARFNATFTGAAFIDERLYVADDDGSQWLFEANPEWRA